jgi:glycine dehydrogenase subunit 1
LTRVPGVRRLFRGPVFHEEVIALDRPTEAVLEKMTARGILGGLDLGEHYPELGPALLVCATETKTSADIEHYAKALAECLREARAAA